MSQNFVYTSTKNFELDITTFGNSNLKNKNCLIFVHGFKGFKDWGFYPYVGKFFADKGYFVITFNFSHNGVSTGAKDFDDLESFAENSLSLEVEELNEIISAYKNNFFGEIDKSNKIGIVGHSRGGAVSILASCKNHNVDALITWASISKIDRFTEHQKTEWKEKGVYEVLNSRTNQLMKLNYSFLTDILENKNESLNIKNVLSNCEIPYLIIHGDQDLTVPAKEANELFSWANNSKTQKEIIKGTGHTFDIKHPFEESTKAFDLVLQKTNNFLSENFQSN